MTAAHCIGGIAFDWCIEAGVDVIEHGYILTQEQISRLSSSSPQIVLTASIYMSTERIRSLPRYLVVPHLEAADAAKASMAAIVASGIPFAVGTDGVHGPGALYKEISYLIELGASTHQAISAATILGARICGLGNITGTIEKDKAADIVGIKTNPLEDCDALLDICCVISQGEIIKSE